MKLHNTSALPMAVFYIPAGEGERKSTVLQPGASTEVQLAPGDTLKTRVATELTDPADAPATDATKEA